MERIWLCLLCGWLLSGCTRGESAFDGGRVASLAAEPFAKWMSALARMERLDTRWPDARALPEAQLALHVNAVINGFSYIDDKALWGQNDYWETPEEFFRQGGGDCEDFALAKYLWLRDLGVPEERLRIVVVYDRYKQLPHALLMFSSGGRTLILDNQIPEPDSADALLRYQPLYSLNRREGWVYI